MHARTYDIHVIQESNTRHVSHVNKPVCLQPPSLINRGGPTHVNVRTFHE